MNTDEHRFVTCDGEAHTGARAKVGGGDAQQYSEVAASILTVYTAGAVNTPARRAKY
jgi:hypothetical protein